MGYGLLFACIYSLFVAGVFAVRGRAAFAANDVSFSSVVALYAIGGVLAGAIVGALRPATKHRCGAVATGIIAAAPVLAGAMLILKGSHALSDPGGRFSVVRGERSARWLGAAT